MPEWKSFEQWLGWSAVLFLVLLFLDSMFTNLCRAWAARKK